ncbi:virion protein [Thalassotalea piscium]|uniref:Structural protein P5 n=1 Tax=Thalassotalea piscium TaxID=1230533 RepID=A0A7X0NG93_9GAMM|nr:virion protein [Thalassotalea piscium]MBB6542854.1 hypothetical protein [Thalassotalea piscium]
MKRTNDLPRGIRNNNPLNIRKTSDNWQGATGDDGEFVIFESPVKGIRAASRILRNYSDNHGLNTVFGIIMRWAPPSENDSTGYIDSVSAKIGLGRNEVLRSYDYPDLIKAMIYHENGQQPYSESVINSGFKEGFYT